ETEGVDHAQRERDRQDDRQREVPAGEPGQGAEQADAYDERRGARDEVDRHRLPGLHLPDQSRGVADEQLIRLRGGGRRRLRLSHLSPSYPTTNWCDTTRSG